MAPSDLNAGTTDGGGEATQANPTKSLDSLDFPNTPDPFDSRLNAVDAIKLRDEDSTREIGAVNQTDELSKDKTDKKPLSFLEMPPEVRNKIYRESLVSQSTLPQDLDDYDSTATLSQPALTLANRQVRAEALPVYYGENIILQKYVTNLSKNWTCFARKIVDAFTGIPSSSPGSSSLGHITNLYLELSMSEHIFQMEVQMSSGELIADTTTSWPEWRNMVRVGTTDLDWTDADAVRAACNKAADDLVANLDDELYRIFMARMSGTAHQNALNAVCVLASACPHLTRSVFIKDCTEVDWDDEFDDGWDSEYYHDWDDEDSDESDF